MGFQENSMGRKVLVGLTPIEVCIMNVCCTYLLESSFTVN